MSIFFGLLVTVSVSVPLLFACSSCICVVSCCLVFCCFILYSVVVLSDLFCLVVVLCCGWLCLGTSGLSPFESRVFGSLVNYLSGPIVLFNLPVLYISICQAVPHILSFVFSYVALPRLVLCYLVASGLVLSRLVSSCLVLSCLVLSGLSCLVLSCRVVSCRVLSCRVLSCRVVSCRVLSCLVLSYLVLSCLALTSNLVLPLFIFTQSMQKNRFSSYAVPRVVVEGKGTFGDAGRTDGHQPIQSTY